MVGENLFEFIRLKFEKTYLQNFSKEIFFAKNKLERLSFFVFSSLMLYLKNLFKTFGKPKPINKVFANNEIQYKFAPINFVFFNISGDNSLVF